MRIFLLAVACIIVGVIVGSRMAAEGSLPGCTIAPSSIPSTTTERK